MPDAATVGPAAGVSFDYLLSNPSLGARRMNMPAGTALYQPTDPARHIYCVHRGQVRTFQIGADDSARLQDILGPGEWTGTAALAQLPTYGMRAVVVVPSVVSEVSAERMLAALAQQPQLAVELVRQLAGALQAAREDAALLVFDDCHHRLIKTLVRFSQTAAATPQDDGVILRITHRQLAQAVGVARETVSLALTQLRHRNLLRTGRNQLFFNPEALKRFEEGSMGRVA